MKILLTNDDGIDSDGLRQLLDELCKIADVYIVAPDSERSSYSHMLTISGGLRIEEREVANAVKAYALWGSPADCAHLALRFLFKGEIDLVVSGINRGPNVSTDIIYSGTIAAAREAFIHGIPAMAVSLYNFHPDNYYSAAKYAKEIAQEFYKIGDNKDYFISVNVPDIPYEQIKGIRVCDDIAHIHYHDNYTLVKRDGNTYVDISFGQRTVDCDYCNPNIDMVAVEEGYVAVSPLYNQHMDKAHRDSIKILEK